MQHSFPAELSEGGQGSQNPCQAGQGMLPEELVPNTQVSRSWAWMLPVAEHPFVPCKDPAEMQTSLHSSSLFLIHQSFGVYI